MAKSLPTPKVHDAFSTSPLDVVTTLNDPQGRPTIAGFWPNYGVPTEAGGTIRQRHRRNADDHQTTETLPWRMAHPRYGLDKEYQADRRGHSDQEVARQAAERYFHRDRKTAPAEVEVIFVEDEK